MVVILYLACSVPKSCLILSNPINCSPPGSCQWDSPGKNTGVGCHFLLQGIFLTQILNPRLLGLLHWQADSLQLSHLGTYSVQNMWPLSTLNALILLVLLLGSTLDKCVVLLRDSVLNLTYFELVFVEKAEEPEIKLPTFAGSSKKQESSRKMYISALLTMPKPLTVWITINCGKFLKRWAYQTI